MVGELKRRRVATSLLAAIFAPVGMALAGGIGVDDFSNVEHTWPETLTTPGTISVTEFNATGFGPLGARRTTEITLESVDEDFDEASLGIFATPGLLNFSSSAGADGMFSLIYDGPGGADLNANLSTEDRVQVEILDFDDAFAIGMPVTLTLDDGSASGSTTENVMIAGDSTVNLLFANLDNPVDLTSINSITLSFQAPVGADFRIDQIVAIPEPATVALMLVAGMLIRRR